MNSIVISTVRFVGRQQKREDRIKKASRVKVEIDRENNFLEGTVVRLKDCWLRRQIMDFWLVWLTGSGMNCWSEQVDEPMLWFFFLNILFTTMVGQEV